MQTLVLDVPDAIDGEFARAFGENDRPHNYVLDVRLLAEIVHEARCAELVES